MLQGYGHGQDRKGWLRLLTAITSGKAGRIELNGTDQRVSWRDVFRRSEDLLTAVFFSRLRFLSQSVRTDVLSLLVGKSAAETLGDLEGLEFWPKLTGLARRGWVEPDVLIWFQEALVVVEVKPPFGGNQYLEQWQAEIQALIAEVESGNREVPSQVHFLALGQNPASLLEQARSSIQTHSLFDLEIHTREWAGLIGALGDLDNQLDGPDGAVFSDWFVAFELFGMHQSPKDWRALVEYSATISLSLEGLHAWEATALKESNLSSLAISPETLAGSWASLMDYMKFNPLSMGAIR